MGQVATVEETIFQWFEHFHQNPEPSWKEYETTKAIVSILNSLRVSYRTFDDVTGVVAEIGHGQEVIAVRADIDALWQEVDGIMRANHSCGHDANISMVLGALLYLHRKPLNKRIRFIFQPAEETGNGALAMIERGVADDVSQLYGVHLRPIEELSFGQVAPAIHHGAVAFLNGRIIGVDAHGARPHQGKNAIDVVFAIQQMLKNIYLAPTTVYSAKLTKIVADGGSVNIIPGTATFSIDIRAQKNEVLSTLQQKVNDGLASIQQQFDIGLEWDWVNVTPAAEVAEEVAEIVRTSIIESVGKGALAEEVVTPGSDDFHFYTIKRSEIQATMIGVGADLQPGLHHPNMTFNKEALLIGAKVLAQTLLNAAR